MGDRLRGIRARLVDNIFFAGQRGNSDYVLHEVAPDDGSGRPVCCVDSSERRLCGGCSFQEAQLVELGAKFGEDVGHGTSLLEHAMAEGSDGMAKLQSRDARLDP